MMYQAGEGRRKLATAVLARRARLVLLTVTLAGAAVLGACSTTEGAGKDLSKLGNSIEDSARRNK